MKYVKVLCNLQCTMAITVANIYRVHIIHKTVLAHFIL